MEYNSNSNIKNENEKNNWGILVPIIYIKRALQRIWSFVLKGLSIGFNCKFIYFIIIIIVALYIGFPILLEKRNNQFILWLNRNGGFKKEFISKISNDENEIL